MQDFYCNKVFLHSGTSTLAQVQDLSTFTFTQVQDLSTVLCTAVLTWFDVQPVVEVAAVDQQPAVREAAIPVDPPVFLQQSGQALDSHPGQRVTEEPVGGAPLL